MSQENWLISWWVRSSYRACLGLGALLSLPWWLYRAMRHGRYRGALLSKWGLTLPSPLSIDDRPIIWLHAVSLGETKAAIPLWVTIRKELPSARMIFSATTETGLAAGCQTFPEAERHFLLPIDLRSVAKRLVRRLRPQLLLLVEGDLWYHLLSEVKAAGGRVALVNGKISERSCRRYSLVPHFTRMLLSQIDRFSLQSAEFEKKFLCLGVDSEKIAITGNLKLDGRPALSARSEAEKLRQRLHLREGERVITIASTHDGEERMLLEALTSASCRILLAPRHPERFAAVAALLSSMGLQFARWSKMRVLNQQIVLVDIMGVLAPCYLLSDLAIVGGSFVPGIGGHNILEPIQHGIPVLFGPHMEAQQQLRDMVLEAGAGVMAGPTTLPSLLQNHHQIDAMRSAGAHLVNSLSGVATATWQQLLPLLPQNK